MGLDLATDSFLVEIIGYEGSIIYSNGDGSDVDWNDTNNYNLRSFIQWFLINEFSLNGKSYDDINLWGTNLTDINFKLFEIGKLNL